MQYLRCRSSTIGILDYNEEKADLTGPNILFKALPELSFYDKKLDAKISRKKVPTSRRDFARLNKMEQSHLIAGAFHPDRGVKLNRTTNQYGCQIQRYCRKLYIQQFADASENAIEAKTASVF